MSRRVAAVSESVSIAGVGFSGRPPEPAPPSDALVSFVLDLPGRVSSVAVSRAAISGLRAFLSRPRLQRFELITSEVVTNAVRHGCPDPGDLVRFEVVVRPDTAVASVLDRGQPFHAPVQRPEAGSVEGFGLLVTAELAAWWQVEHTGGGNRVTYAV